jgi:hypothetical protein
MTNSAPSTRPALRLVEGPAPAELEWSWFCGHCAAPPPGGEPPIPTARVCSSCGLGLLLEARADVIPGSKDPFLVVDSALRVQAVSRRAEVLLGVDEAIAVNTPVMNLLVPADAEAQGPTRFAAAIANGVALEEPIDSFVRPWNTFGVRMRVRIAPCGPPRAALLVLDGGAPKLRAV